MNYHEFTIQIPEAFKDALINRMTRNGCLGVIEQEGSLVAFFPGNMNKTSIVDDLEIIRALLEKSHQTGEFSYRHALLPEQDWNESWKKGFTPLDVGERFTVLPPWEQKHEDRINLVIDPGMAFGTGHHETTRSCLVLIEKYDRELAKERFLDLGTGTGLLAIAASKLGYKQVMAVDTDPLATEAARMNAGLNEVANVEIREGSISETSGTFDCIAANIISGVLMLLAPLIASRLGPSGIAVLSGILADQADEVLAEMREAGLTLKERFPDGKWVSLVVGKRH
jgi:ribosomal protein L11 methyltransferase